MKIILAALAFWFVLSGDLTWASGNVRVSWRQDNDCQFVHHWELQVAGAPVADLTGTCGGVMTSVLTIEGVGPKAFRLRALTTEGYSSDWSNTVTATLPLGAPSLTEVKLE